MADHIKLPNGAVWTDHSVSNSVGLIMKWADIYAAQTGNLYSEAAHDPSKVARMADERERLLEVVRQVIVELEGTR